MNFNSQTPVKEIAVSSSAAAQVLENAGIDYCCGGAKTLGDACATAGASPEGILERLQAEAAQVGPGDANWVRSALSELTEHIRRKHHEYVREAIPRISELAAKVKARHGAGHPEIAKIEELFSQLGREMIAHMQKEEIVLFPYIERLERARNAGKAIERPFFQTVRNPIQMMMNEHDAAGELARQIREAGSNYAVPAGACASYEGLYNELRDFEADLHQHVHLENNILFPRALELEGRPA